ncbi:MAG TPA: FecR domain-containing protein [Burkholderiales bacterium]|nr:FecR domain-containing protein [Burkholderiales bacterium]
MQIGRSVLGTRWLIAMALSLFAGLAIAADAGHIKTAKGSAFVERDGQRIAATAGMAILESDTLVTGEDGSMGVTMADNCLLSIGPNSELAIEKYAFNSTTHAGNFDASLRQGSLAVVSGKMVKQSPDAMRVRTPATVMAVRGTEFVVKVH